MVIWITGLSGAGKTTLCLALKDMLKPRLPELVILDGDEVREAFGHNLSYSESDRILQVKRLQTMAGVLSRQGLIVIVGVLYNNPELLRWNRENFSDYHEIYLDVSLDAIMEQDVKGLYSAAHEGREKNVVGVDIEWNVPDKADLVFNTDDRRPPEEMARTVAERVPRLAEAIKN
jgi:adenylylsulfate kinase-like enzyme